MLEGREVPAVITVTSLLDNTTVDGLVTLREAIQAVETDLPVDGSAAGCGNDTIVFAPAGGTVTLALGVLNLTDTTHGTITVDGGGAVTVDGGNASRVFKVNTSVNATLTGLTITHGRDGFGGVSVG